MFRSKRWWPDPSEEMPLDFLPCSNGEYSPGPPSAEQQLATQLQNEEGERLRRRMGLSRRDFVRTAAAFGVGLWAIRQLALGPDRARADHTTGAECTLEYPGTQLNNLPGEFILDVQNHHLDDEDQSWRATQPAFDAFSMIFFAQSDCGDPNHIDCYGRFHYIKEVFVDSSTNVAVLSGIPSSLDKHPLPPPMAAETSRTAAELAGTQRSLFHPFLFPNRGYAGRFSPGRETSLYLEEELERMTSLQAQFGDVLRGWKLYTPYGEVPAVSGYHLDDPEGIAVIEHALALGVPLICAHKGLATPPFDVIAAACRDVGVVGRAYPDMSFVVYHSGFNEEEVGPYPGDAATDSSEPSIDSLIKALRENRWSARDFASGPDAHANSPNVYAELGATWRIVSNRFDPVGDGRMERIQAAHLLGKLIYYVGPKRVVWGTDSIWHGSPQGQIVAMRTFPLPEETEARRILAEQYHLPYGLDGDVDDPSQNALDGNTYRPWNRPSERNWPPRGQSSSSRWPTDGKAHPERSIRNGIFGRNAAAAYDIDVDVEHGFISCDDLQEIRNEYILSPGTEAETRPLASNTSYGPRTRREFLAARWPNRPWQP